MLGFIFAGNSYLSAQQVKISPELTLRSEDYFQILGKLGDRILLLRERTGRIQIDSYTEDLSFIKSDLLEFDRRTVNLIAAIPQDSTFAIIYSLRNKNEYSIRADYFDYQMYLVDTATVINYGTAVENPYFVQDPSEDASKILIFTTPDEETLEALVFDLIERRLLWARSFTFEQNLREVYREALISNQGDLYVFGEANSRRIGKDRSYFNLLYYNYRIDATNYSEYIIKDVYIQDYILKMDNFNNTFICSGLYGEKNNNRSSGFFNLMVNGGNPTDYQIQYHEFETEIYREMYGEDADKKKGLSDLACADVVLREDGGFIFINEVEKVYERRSSYGTRNYARDFADGRWVDYYHEDLVLYSIDPDGDIHWFDVLRKKQFSQDDLAVYSSYFVFSTPTHIRLLYNDEIRNNSSVSEYIVTPDGRSDRNAVMSTDYQKLRLRFKDAVQIGGREVVVPSDRNAKFSLVKIAY